MPEVEFDQYPPKSDLSTYYECVGRVAMGWAAFEMRLNHAIWRLAGVEQYAGACLTAQIVAPLARLRALIALARYRGASEARCKALNKLSTKVDEVARQRNRIVHDPAFTNEEQTFRLHITADRSVDFGMKPTGLRDFFELEQKVVQITKDFRREMSAIFSELPPYDDTSFQNGEGITPGPLPE